MSAKPHREAGFKVAAFAPDVPSVLVELGYLSSQRDLDLLALRRVRGRVTAEMSSAIETFFAGRGGAARRSPKSAVPRAGRPRLALTRRRPSFTP